MTGEDQGMHRCACGNELDDELPTCFECWLANFRTASSATGGA